jgi:integrase
MQKQRFWLYCRAGVFYLHDSQTGHRESLHTRSKREAERTRLARNEAVANPQVGMALARSLLAVHDPKMSSRTWQEVMEEFCRRGKPQTQARRRRAVSRAPLCLLRDRKLIESTAEEFMGVLRQGGTMAQATLRCLQNLATGLGWLPWPVLPNKLWPTVRRGDKRGVTGEEHQRIRDAERNPERRLYYELLWETGASQSDAALLRAENIDWSLRVVCYQRQKTGEFAHLRIGQQLEAVLRQLPAKGLLFPKIARSRDSARAAEFHRRCRLLAIQGISLHSYRYAWAERAKSCGYPERWAQNALGHNSPAVHQAYAKQGIAVCPPLDEYEQALREKVVPLTGLAAGQPTGAPSGG